MAEEELNYKVNFDEIDLAQKLDRIRNQIDMALGQAAAGAAPLPLASDLLSFAGPMGAGQVGAAAMGMAQPQFSPDIPATFSTSQDASFWSQASQYLDQAAQSTQLGFGKFTSDLRRTGLISPVDYPSFSAPLLSMDPTESSFQQGASRFAASWSGTAAGAAIGSIIPGVGTGLGAFIGGGLDLAADVFAAEAYQRRDLGDAFQEIASQSFGSISSSQAEGIARGLQMRVNSFDSMASGLDMPTAQNAILGFANAGGFSRAQGPEDMSQITQGLLDNFREFARNLNVAQDEAVQIMAQLERQSSFSTQEAGAISARMGMLGEQYSMNASDLLGLGLQGSQMVQGTGITAQQGFNMMISSRGQVNRMMMSSDPLTRQLMADYATPEQAAIAQMESGLRFMQSGQGMMFGGAMLGGYSAIPGANGSLSGMLNAFAGYAGSDINNLLGLPAANSMLAGQLDPMQMNAMQVGSIVDQLSMSGLEPNEDTIVSMLMQQGMNFTDAATMVRSIQTGIGDPSSQAAQEALAMIDSATPGRSILSQVSAGLSRYGQGVMRQTGLSILGEAQAGVSDVIGTGIENFIDQATGQIRYRGSGNLSSAARKLLNDEEALLVGTSKTVSFRQQISDAEDFLSGTDSNFIYGGRTPMNDTFMGIFAREGFGMSDQARWGFYKDLADQQDRSAMQVQRDVAYLDVVQDLNTQDLSGVGTEVGNLLDQINITEEISSVQDKNSISAVLDQISLSSYDKNKRFGQLSRERQQIVFAAAMEHRGSSQILNAGLDQFSNTNMQARDPKAAVIQHRLEQAEGLAGEQINRYFSGVQESDDFKYWLKKLGVSQQDGISELKRVKNLVQSGAYESIKDIEESIDLYSSNSMVRSSRKAILRAMDETEGGADDLFKSAARLSAVRHERKEYNFAINKGGIDQILEAVGGVEGIGEEQIDLLKEGIMTRLSQADQSGSDFTMAFGNLDSRGQADVIKQLTSTLSTASIDRQENLSRAIGSLGSRIQSGVISRLTDSGDLEAAEQLDNMLNPYNGMESAMRALHRSFEGSAMRVKVVEANEDIFSKLF